MGIETARVTGFLKVQIAKKKWVPRRVSLLARQDGLLVTLSRIGVARIPGMAKMIAA